MLPEAYMCSVTSDGEYVGGPVKMESVSIIIYSGYYDDSWT